MKANELRIGNYFLDHQGRAVKIHGIDSTWNYIWLNYADGSSIFCLELNRIKPIPLTPEILEKCGALDFGYHWEIGDVHLDWSSKIVDTGERMGISVVGSPHIKYLHLLQNLIYAKTGEELNVKL